MQTREVVPSSLHIQTIHDLVDRNRGVARFRMNKASVALPAQGHEYVRSMERVFPSGSKKAAAWVKAKTRHPSQETKLQKGDRLKTTLKVADNEELVGWILRFGGEVKVVRPEELKQKVREEAEKVLSAKP